MTQKVNSEIMSFNSEFQTFGAITRSLVCRTACSSHRHAKHRSTAESLGVVGLYLCTEGNAILYCIVYSALLDRHPAKVVHVNASMLLIDHTAIPRLWSCGVSHKFAHAKKAILRHRLLVDTLKSYVNIITVSILFTVPHLIVLYIWTITSACCMHTLMLTASRSVVVDTNIHSMSSIIVSWRLMTASTHGEQMLINCKNSSVLSLHADVQSWIVVLSSHCILPSAIPNSLNSRLQWSFIVHHTTFCQHT